jgi:hypothetical protein
VLAVVQQPEATDAGRKLRGRGVAPRAFTASAHRDAGIWVLPMGESGSGSGRPGQPSRRVRSNGPSRLTAWPAVLSQDGMVSRPEPGLSLAEGWRRSGLTVFELWLIDFAMGGDAPGLELEAYLYDVLHPSREHNPIAQALNSQFRNSGPCYLVGYLPEPR